MDITSVTNVRAFTCALVDVCVCQMQNKASITESILPVHLSPAHKAPQCGQSGRLHPGWHHHSKHPCCWARCCLMRSNIELLPSAATRVRDTTLPPPRSTDNVVLWIISCSFPFLLHTSLPIIDHSDIMSSWLHVLKESDSRLFVNPSFQSNFNLSLAVKKHLYWLYILHCAWHTSWWDFADCHTDFFLSSKNTVQHSKWPTCILEYFLVLLVPATSLPGSKKVPVAHCTSQKNDVNPTYGTGKTLVSASSAFSDVHLVLVWTLTFGHSLQLLLHIFHRLKAPISGPSTTLST